MTIEEIKNFLVPGGTHENTLLQDKEKLTMEKKKTLDEGGEEKWALRLFEGDLYPKSSGYFDRIHYLIRPLMHTCPN